jgi:hypothetical protein
MWEERQREEGKETPAIAATNVIIIITPTTTTITITITITTTTITTTTTTTTTAAASRKKSPATKQTRADSLPLKVNMFDSQKTGATTAPPLSAPTAPVVPDEVKESWMRKAMEGPGATYENP